MKKAITFLFLFFSLAAFTQDITLTKGETIEYLRKKAIECEGFTSHHGNIIKDINVKMENGFLTISYGEYYKVTDKLCLTYEYKFNPADIKSFSNSTNCNSTICTMSIYLISKIGKQKVKGENGCGSSEEKDPYTQWISMYFLVKDGTNQAKIKKAFLHLQALLKAEDDPFGN